jgi:serine-type D-Ala-D-Ala carboxypeptidase (penicillin-binding protein 5/6)
MTHKYTFQNSRFDIFRALFFIRITQIIIILLLFCHNAFAANFETKALNAFMIDAETGTILYEKNPDTLIPPASLAKLMTLELVFHSVKTGAHSFSEAFKISENAWRTGGAPSGGYTMFAKLGSMVALQDLIKAVSIQSANDAAIALAEGFAGSEAQFAKLMIQRARDIGLSQSVFKNATGFPIERQLVTVRDMALLGLHIWKKYPDFYRLFSEQEFSWNDITQRNRNPLLPLAIGVDGLATAYSEQSGYGIITSKSVGGRRVFLAMSGLENEQTRVQEAKKMLEWGIASFSRVSLFQANAPIGEASVYGGTSGVVKVGSQADVSVLIGRDNQEKVKLSVDYQGPVLAPIEKGQHIGFLTVTLGEKIVQKTPVFALEQVEQGALTQRAFDGLIELCFGWIKI